MMAMTGIVLAVIGIAWTALALIANRALRPDAVATRLERLSALWPLPGVAAAVVGVAMIRSAGA